MNRSLFISGLILASLAAASLSAQTVTVDKTSLTFSAQNQGAVQSQTLTVTSSGGNVQFGIFSSTTSSPAWLKVNGQTSAILTTPAMVTVTADPTGLNPGTYSGTLTVSGSGASTNIIVNVTFAVSTIGANPSSLNFTYTVGSNIIPGNQSIALSGTGNYTAAATTQSGGSWLAVSPTAGSAPGAIIVSVSPAVVTGLPSQSTPYQGTISITPSGTVNNTPILIPVTLTVLPTPPVTANPTSIVFNVQQGGTNNITSEPLTIATTPGQQLNFSVQSSVSSGPNWITVNPTAGNTDSTSGTAQIAVGYSLNGLAVGNTYRGTVTLITTGGTPPSTSIPVTLNYSATALLNVPTNTLNFLSELGGSAPADQTVNVSSTSTVLSYSLSQSTNSAWLTIPNAGNTGTPFNVHVNPAGLAPGTYTATINVTPQAAGSTAQQIPVVLKISNDPFIATNVNTTAGLSFPFQTGQPAPAAQTITVASSTGVPLTFTATPTVTNCGSNWLLLNGATTPVTGTTNSSLTVAIATSGLPAGTCSGSISIAATAVSTGVAAVNSPLTIPITVVVAGTPMLVATPTSLAFAAPVGQSPAAQTVTLTSTSGTDILNYAIASVSGTSNGTTWLFAGPTSGTTATNNNNILTVTINSGSLPAGIYNGTVTLNGTTSGGTAVANSPVTIPVTLTVTSGALTLSATSLNFSYTLGAASPASQTVTVGSSTGNPLAYSATASSSPTNWLNVSPANGSTNGSPTLTVSVDGTKLTAAGTYNGSISVVAAGSSQNISVTVVVTAGTISAPTTTLSFVQAAGGTAPAAQTIAVTGSPSALTFTVTTSTVPAGGTWLTATPTTGTTPASVSVAVNAGSLAVGQYSGQVVITSTGASGSPITVPVVLNVTQAGSATVTPTSLTFSSIAGQPAPAAQSLTVNSATALPISVTAQSTGAWLQVTPTSGTTPVTLSVSVSPSALAASSTPYTGTITITSPNLAGPLTVPVSLTVSTVPTPVINAITNAASGATGAVSPGENIVIYGTGIGPAQLTGIQVSNGVVSTISGNTRVLFDGVAAPVIYASANQTSVMVPYGVSGRTSTNVQVEYLGVQSAAINYQVTQTAPGIYSLNLSGTGPGATLNQNGSVNSQVNPAAKGSVVTVYMTGEGQTSPAGVNGAVTPLDGTGLKNPLQGVTATIGGVQAQVAYSGSAPGIVSGVMQVNLVVPAGTASGGAVPLVIAVGGVNSQAGITISIQ